MRVGKWVIYSADVAYPMGTPLFVIREHTTHVAVTTGGDYKGSVVRQVNCWGDGWDSPEAARGAWAEHQTWLLNESHKEQQATKTVDEWLGAKCQRKADEHEAQLGAYLYAPPATQRHSRRNQFGTRVHEVLEKFLNP